MPFWNKTTFINTVSHPPLKGVNLGGWLVLEKWMTPSLFKDTAARDEYTFSQELTKSTRARLQAHRDTFITKADFVWLREQGIEAVRLPVGYWTFGDVPPYQATIEYVDQAFAWAAETGIYIMLDLHGAPGSQNGWDHSGRAGACEWGNDECHIISTLEILSKLAKRYAKHPQLLGIELLNEPKQTLPKAALLRYYTAACKLIRKECGPHIWIVFHDNFRPRRWQRLLSGTGYSRVLIDTHQYQTFTKNDKKLDIAGHIKKTNEQVPRLLEQMRRTHPVVVGEWSLTLDPLSLKGLNGPQLEAARQAYCAAQLLAYSQASAWFYWSYRLETTNGHNTWSFRNCIEQGWIPRLD